MAEFWRLLPSSLSHSSQAFSKLIMKRKAEFMAKLQTDRYQFAQDFIVNRLRLRFALSLNAIAATGLVNSTWLWIVVNAVEIRIT